MKLPEIKIPLNKTNSYKIGKIYIHIRYLMHLFIGVGIHLIILR